MDLNAKLDINCRQKDRQKTGRLLEQVQQKLSSNTPSHLELCLITGPGEWMFLNALPVNNSDSDLTLS